MSRLAARSLWFSGTAVHTLPPKARARRIAALPQKLPDAADFLVRELVMLGRFPWQGWLQRPSAEDVARVEEAMAQTDVARLAAQPVNTLSGGERQRAWLAMCLAQQSEVLLLDEPLAALDIVYSHPPKASYGVASPRRTTAYCLRRCALSETFGGWLYQVEVLQLVRQLIAARGLTVVVIIHDINLAARFCDALIALKGGRLCRFAPVGEVMSAAALQEVFGVRLHLLDHPDGKHRVAVV